MEKRLTGSIEGGGTKFVCAIIDEQNQILSRRHIPTTVPSKTLNQCLAFFKQGETILGKIEALGIACFGPLDSHRNSPTYGQILATPKSGWANTDLVGFFKEALDIPLAFDTDVNAAALAEWKWGAGQALSDLVYYTIGTGIGGGAIVSGKLLHGLSHPEMGHVRLPRLPEDQTFKGNCPFHDDCFEGLASGPAMAARWGQAAETLMPDHPAWEMEAAYIALALVGTICSLSPERIILGGGVMNQRFLFPMIRAKVLAYLNGYIQNPKIIHDIENYIVPPGLGTNAGLLGGKALVADLG
jgi:fructokinase